jgi:hypothetical protein
LARSIWTDWTATLIRVANAAMNWLKSPGCSAALGGLAEPEQPVESAWLPQPSEAFCSSDPTWVGF